MADPWRGLDPDRADPADEHAPQTAFQWRTPEGVERETYMVASSLPYYQQRKPSVLARVVVFTLLRRDRCKARWWCSWPATERGGTCDPHGGGGQR